MNKKGMKTENLCSFFKTKQNKTSRIQSSNQLIFLNPIMIKLSCFQHQVNVCINMKFPSDFLSVHAYPRSER